MASNGYNWTSEGKARRLAAVTKHGAYSGGKESAEHYIWRTMLRRNVGKGSQYYVGVKVCQRWKDSFEDFLADVGPRPSPEHQLDREDPHGDYEPGNVRWATRSVQQKNKRTTVLYSENGVELTASEWAEKLGISKELASWRWKNWGTFIKGRTWQARLNTK